MVLLLRPAILYHPLPTGEITRTGNIVLQYLMLLSLFTVPLHATPSTFVEQMETLTKNLFFFIAVFYKSILQSKMYYITLEDRESREGVIFYQLLQEWSNQFRKCAMCFKLDGLPMDKLCDFNYEVK